MASQFAEVTIKEILQIIKQAVSKIHKEGEEVWFESFTGKASSFLNEFINETGEKVFLFTNAN